ncbi:MAG: RNA 2',3'-cyclic phosphodiesterase [Candidatus Methanomethylicia archaeon]|nr:RNA 2',3'-cyclic phosphodiesterase [Candidatus Methanomethylicia archaeon]MCX8169009.1 RNA 2',3'-cyclic phosphodiesterase [Candidatus Methanomethylicia archaeon]MDW7988741.1 RNA 2',3'-cyclic phosphodiesterase [Nitrososphaerota archaeon]
MSLIRAFIAIDVSEEIIYELIKVQESLKLLDLDIKFVERENIHLTLKFLGEIPQEKINRVCNVMKNMYFPKFYLEVKGLGVFPFISKPRVIWAGVSEGYQNIVEIFHFLDSNLKKLNFKSEVGEFTPHITLGRFKSGRNVHLLANFIQDYRNISFGKFAVGFVCLKKSVLTPRGPIYSDLFKMELM